jgi:alpha-N-arabinofuranosidase
MFCFRETYAMKTIILLIPALALAILFTSAAAAANVPKSETRISAATAEKSNSSQQDKPDLAIARLRIRTAERSPYPIPRYITGKFCEHLFFNITKGMDAQILVNPTFAEYPFWTGQMSPDGVATFHYDRQQIAQQIRQQASRWGWPESEIETLIQSYNDGLTCWWSKVGVIQTSPDTSPYGGRAQRVQITSAGQGIAQWTYLPLHRVRRYEFQLFARSPDISSLTVGFFAPDGRDYFVKTDVPGLTREWKMFEGMVEIPANLPDDKSYKFALTANTTGQFVIAQILLRPADHIGGADPDVVRLLKESKLPILRWPGGNFVSGYHWEDGVGPLEKRPTVPNYAWGQPENNLFGTDEFIAFCQAVGCEPMICINAGSGTSQEAARWIEYCNGSLNTPMGALRAANGHPQSYNVRHWEVGNELWGRWQYHWTTAEGYADRYKEFTEAMLKADPTIKLYACGAPVMWGKQWNDILIKGAAGILTTMTDHPLIGGNVPCDTDPLDVYRDFMAVPVVLEQKWAQLREDMKKAGIKEPHLAVTELQMFARLGEPSKPDAPKRLNHDNLVSPQTLAEALYNVLIYHSAVRLAPFVEMVTHSATINHGGGLRKSRERVFANPCHYSQAMFADFGGARPVSVELESPQDEAPLVLPDLKNVTAKCSYKAIDALAAVGIDDCLLISVIHRGTRGPIQLEIMLDDYKAQQLAQIQTLSADVPWAANTSEKPQVIKTVDSTAVINNNRVLLRLPPYSFTRLRIPKYATQ